jgi:hypothetical protein
MTEDLNLILDKCIDRLNKGETLESCLADYPEHKEELGLLLKAAGKAESAYSFIPSPEKKREARQKFYAEIESRRQPSFWHRFARQKLAWASTAGVLLLLIVSLVFLRPVLWPGTSDVPVPNFPSIIVPEASANGNFIFMVSDDVNAIDEFSTVNVTIDKVWLLKAGDEEEWVEFTPSTQQFDLALLPGEKTQELWQGNIPTGDYTRVVIFVKQVQGVLKTGATTEITLPSDKLQIKSSFTVSADTITSFTYDLTVVKVGNDKQGFKYLLKPQAGESGATQSQSTAAPPEKEPSAPPDKEKGPKK